MDDAKSSPDVSDAKSSSLFEEEASREERLTESESWRRERD
jgi:hypothetical protein